MNTAKVAAALNTISLAFGELAEALSDGAAPVLAAPRALPPLAADEGPEFPPTEYEAVGIPANAEVLSVCPNHGTPWSIKPAGVSKTTSKPYSAFYKCDGKNPDNSYCAKKPTREWADAHPIR